MGSLGFRVKGLGYRGLFKEVVGLRVFDLVLRFGCWFLVQGFAGSCTRLLGKWNKGGPNGQELGT